MNKSDKYSIILFDGVCNLCNGAVNFIIDRDSKNIFKFATLQSEAAQALLQKHRLPQHFLESLVLVENGRVYQKSTAALRIARNLDFPWSLCYIFIAIPTFVRDIFYRIIAKYRYKLFGKSSVCRYPSEDLKAKFLF